MIFKPTEWLRLGGAFHTPTYYWSMSDKWYTNTTADLVGFDSYESILGTFDYDMTTPLRAIGSLGFIFGQNAFVTLDYEYTDYSKSKFSSKGYGYNEVNADISSVFQQTHNFRGGIEYRYSNLSFRGGYALYGSPYANNLNDGKRQLFSAGIGYRNNDLALDFAYVYSTKNENYYLYTSDNYQTNPASNEFKSQQFMVSLRYFVK